MSARPNQTDMTSLLAAPLVIGPALALIGLSVWTGLSAFSGFQEAWEMPVYFYVGLPVMMAAVSVASFYMPRRIWRWPLWLVGGHQAGVFLVGLGMQSGLSLIILLVVLAVLLAALLSIPAFVGALMARRVTQRAY
jgi:hypothetical protein